MNESFWMRHVTRCVGAASEVMFPTNELGAPDWRDTDMVNRTVSYLLELPPRPRHLVMLMFVAIEFAAPFLLVGLGRFSRIGAERRSRALHRWRASGLPHYRMLSDALKAQLCMMYLSHPAVQKHIGAFKTCAHPNDPLGLPVREDALSGETPNGLRAGFAA